MLKLSQESVNVSITHVVRNRKVGKIAVKSPSTIKNLCYNFREPYSMVCEYHK